MKQLLTNALFLFTTAALVGGTTPVGLHRLDRAELDLLQSAQDPALAQQRAGAVADVGWLTPAERAELSRARTQASQLEQLRGGDLHLDNDELTVIAIVLLAVLIIAVIA